MNLRLSACFLTLLIGDISHATEYDPMWNSGAQGPDGFSWERKVPRAVLEQAPRWTPDQGEIPISPTQAYQKSLTALRTLNLGKFTFKSLVLDAEGFHPTHYRVSLSDKTTNHTVEFLVFMDGTVISPVMTSK